VRHRQTVNSIARTADELVKLLVKLSRNSFAQTITKSDRRDRADTLKKLEDLALKLDEVREKLPVAKKAAYDAAETLTEFIKQQQ